LGGWMSQKKKPVTPKQKAKAFLRYHKRKPPK
jgi:hypothetical protein